MDLSVIENDPKEVKKYLQNFVPINYYKVLDDAYLYQIRAVLLHSVSHAELYNPVYAGLINDLTVTSGKNYAIVNTKIEGLVDNFSALATKTETLEVEAANANASIIEIQQASAEQNKAQASVNQRLEASLDDIVVGGRNIMKNSDFSKGYRAWQEASITKHNHFIGTMHKISTTGIVGSLMGIYPLAEYQNMAMVEGTEYSISFYAYGSILLMDEIYLTSPSEAPIKLPSVVISTDLSERRHITFTAPTGGGGLGLIFGATATSEDDWFSISRIKVELGNKPTDWTPAPEDVEGYINEVQSSIDTFKDVQVERNLATAQTIEKMDTRVKGNAASILEEKNTRVDQFSALSQVTNELTSKTNENEAAIKTVDLTFTDRYNANVSRLGVLEADNSLGKGKIENLESVTTSLGEVVVTQSSTLNAKIDNLTMGGRNLLRNSDFKLGADTWGTSELSYDESIFGNLTTVTNTGTTADYFGLQPVNIFKTVTLIKDKEYVLSFYAKGNIPSINDIWITAEGNLPQQIDSVDITDGISDRYSVVFTANHTTEEGSIIIGASGYAKGKWFAVAAVKLEIGNKASDWTEAPEDSKAFIHDVEANINDFKEVQVKYNEAKAKQLLELTTKTDGNIAEISELREATSNIEGSTAALETKLRGEYVSAISSTKSDITKETDGKIDLVNQTLTEMSTDISSKADITRVDSVENNAKQSLATAKTDLTSSYTSAISTAKTESATDATNKANKAKTDANEYTNGKITTLTTLVDSKADISRVDEVENNAVKSLASTKSVITSEYTSAISTSKEESASDAQIKADKALADANIVTATKATEAQEAAEVYALAKAKAEADAALALAKGDATSKSDAAKSAAIAAAALDAKNKADKALADAKLDATAKADAAKKYAKDLVDTLTITVNSKADITRVDKVVNDSTQALAQAKTDITGAYTLAITESSELSAADAKAKADKALADAAIKATAAQTAAEAYALAEANAKAAAALDSAKSDATTKANKAKADAELAAALDAKKKADEALRLAKLDATAKADAVKDMVVALTKVVDSKASISRVDDIENNATQALATAKTELTSNYTTAITTAKNQSATDAKTKADAALAAAKIDAQDKANAAKTAAETYALAEAKAKADAALVLAKSDATTKANAAKSAAEATAALDAKNKADKALADAKLDATAKANKALADAKTDSANKVAALKTTVDSKATITQLNTVKNDANQALASAKTELTGSYTKAIEEKNIDNTNYFPYEFLSKLENWIVGTYYTADIRIQLEPNTVYTMRIGELLPFTGHGVFNVIDGTAEDIRYGTSGRSVLSAVFNIRSNAITREVISRFTTSDSGKISFDIYSLRYINPDIFKKVQINKGAEATPWAPSFLDVALDVNRVEQSLLTLVDSKANISRVDTVENNANQAVANAKTALTSSYTTAISVAKGESATDAQTRANKALSDAKIDATGKANEAERLAKAHADTKVAALTKIVDSKATISSVEIVENDAKKALAAAKTELTSSYTEAINGIEIGGRNLLLDSQKWVAQKGSVTILGVDNVGSLGIGSAQVFNASQIYSHRLMVGETYTWSMLVASKGSITNVTLYTGNVFSYTKLTNIENINTSGFVKVWVTAKVTGTNVTSSRFHFAVTGTTGSLVYFTGLKVEKGNKATDWSPAPEDVEAAYTASISAESKARSDADTALGTRITTLDTDYKGNKTAIRTELTAVSNKANSTATSLGTLTTTVGGNTTKISQESTARSTADTALGNRITATDAIAKNAQSRVGTAETAISTATSAIATLRTDLKASYNIQDTRATNELPSYYYTNYPRQTVREFKQKSTMTGVVGSGTYVYLETVVRWSSVSGGAIVQTAVTDDNRIYIRTSSSASAWRAWVEQEDVTGSAAKVAALKTALDKDIKATDARITAEKKVAADATSAVAKTVGTLTTTVNGHTSSIKTQQTTINGISAKWSMETNVNGKISGIYQHSTGKSSSVEILADKFSVGTDTKMVKPFTISGNDIVFNGKVSFNSVTGTVSSSQIPTGTISLNHMVLADKNKINTASTTAASAQTKANQAATAAATADSKAVTATTNAATAQTKANQAATAASTADGKAVAAQNATNTLKNNIYYPNTTTIDGGKIRTGSITAASGAIANFAVDTLQIKGQAVTIPKLINRTGRFVDTVLASNLLGNDIVIKKINIINSNLLMSDTENSTFAARIVIDYLNVTQGQSGTLYYMKLNVIVNGTIIHSRNLSGQKTINSGLNFSHDFMALPETFAPAINGENNIKVEIECRIFGAIKLVVENASIALTGVLR